MRLAAKFQTRTSRRRSLLVLIGGDSGGAGRGKTYRTQKGSLDHELRYVN